MSLDEALDNYSLYEFRPSIGDNINRVCYQIYKSLDPHLIRILTTVNVRYDWDYLKPNAVIKYFSREICDSIQFGYGD